jgi:hypothetical protein
LDRILFAQAFAIPPHLSSGELFGMVYEHFSRCFILENPSSELFQVVVVIVACGDILKSMALMLGVNKLLIMAKDIEGLDLFAIGETFLQLIDCSISYNFGHHFKSTYSPISLEY